MLSSFMVMIVGMMAIFVGAHVVYDTAKNESFGSMKTITISLGVLVVTLGIWILIKALETI